MQFVKNTWNRNLGGKLLIGCGGLLSILCLCTVASAIISPRSSVTPTAAPPAVKAAGTVTATIYWSPTETSAPATAARTPKPTQQSTVTAAPTDTPVPPTATAMPTDTPAPAPTSTHTPVPPTATDTPATDTPQPVEVDPTEVLPTAAPVVEEPSPTAESGPPNFDTNGDGKVTCGDFHTRTEAKVALAAGYKNLDGNDDGVPCESLPE